MCLRGVYRLYLVTITIFLVFLVMEENYTDVRELTCSELHEYIHSVCTSCFPHEDPFEAIVIFLHTSIEVRFHMNLYEEQFRTDRTIQYKYIKLV